MSWLGQQTIFCEFQANFPSIVLWIDDNSIEESFPAYIRYNIFWKLPQFASNNFPKSFSIISQIFIDEHL